MEDTLSQIERQATAPGDRMRWAAYEPPTAEQLERRQYIRDNIERLSVRPLRDSVRLNDVRRVRASDKSGLIAVVLLTAALVLTLIWGGLL